MDNKLILIFSILASVNLILSSGLTILNTNANASPTFVRKNNLVIQEITAGLDKPSGLEFLGKQDILVTQKDDGKVKLLRNFDLKKYPILDEKVFISAQDSDLEGIASQVINDITYVLLIYTENTRIDEKQISPFGNGYRVYRYIWDPAALELVDETLILKLPSSPNSTNDNGKITVGLDKQLYTVVSELNLKVTGQKTHEGDQKSLSADNEFKSSIVLRTTLDGLPLTAKGFERSYGFGIRNSSGLAIDPVSGYLWEIENGRSFLGKVNLFKPEFNSIPQDHFRLAQNTSILYDVSGDFLIDDNLSSTRSNPWSVSALLFMNSSVLGSEYINDLIVGSKDGNLYHFDLDDDRDSIIMNNSLSDHVFAIGFGPISDLKIGPDKALYVLTIANNTNSAFDNHSGSLYRIANKSIDLPVVESRAITADYLWIISTVVIVVAILLFLGYLKKYRRKEL